MDKERDPAPELGWFRTLTSILASIAGVASRRRFEEDTARGSWRRYVIVLAALMIVYVLLHVLLVRVLLHYNGQ